MSTTLLERLPIEFQRKCEGIATEQRSRLGFRAFERLPADVLAEHLKATLLTPEQLPSLHPDQVAALYASEAWSAAVISQNPLWIAYNPQHSPARHESNMMHELAHVLLEHPLVGCDPITGFPQRRQKDEDEATYLGSCLQIPRRGLLWAAQRNMTIIEVTDHFGASEAMVRLRCNATGVQLRRLPEYNSSDLEYSVFS